MPAIKIILGSNRPTRFAPQPGQWLLELSKKVDGATFELIDLAEVNLPLLDELESPLVQKYQNEHTKEWSKIINDADGYILVTAEYNHGYTAILKNALDYLYHEWKHKPVGFLSYGAVAGGARAVEQLREVVGHMGMYDLTEHVILPSYYTNMKDSKYQFTPQHEEAGLTLLKSMAFWAGQMKQARETLAARQ